METYNNVDEYIAQCPTERQKILTELRSIIQETVPDAIECLSYRMPAYTLNKKPVAYFAGQKGHIGFYPTGEGISAFKEQLEGMKHSKGCIRLPYNKPLPVDLIKNIVSHNAAKALGK